MNNSALLNQCTGESKMRFTLALDGHVHSFAAVDRNMQTYKRWYTQLKSAEETLKERGDRHEQMLLQLR